MNNQHTDDSHRTISQPFRHCNAQIAQEAGGASNARRFEYADPGHGFTPGGNHVGNDHCQGEKLFAWQIAAHHQPRNETAYQNAPYGNTGCNQQRVQQRTVKHVGRYGTVQNALPIIQCPVTGCPLHASRFRGSQLEGGQHHLQKRPYYQNAQRQNGHDHQQIIGIGKGVFQPVQASFPPGERSRFHRGLRLRLHMPHSFFRIIA